MKVSCTVVLSLLLSGTMSSWTWAQKLESKNHNDASSGLARPATEDGGNDKRFEGGRMTDPSQQILKTGEDEDSKYELTPGEDPQNRLVLPFVEHLAMDQREFWTGPARLQKKDMRWMAPAAGVLAGLIVSDSWTSRQVPAGEVQRSKKFSNYAAYSLIGAGAGSFLLGHITGNDQMSEAGLLSGEAAINSTAVAFFLKSITQRSRPYELNGDGRFFQGGSSFPSEHAAIAWSVASVMAHEYPGKLSQILAYSLATGVTATRVTGQQHFASDAIVGSVLGWYFGRQVYRAHHDTNLGGAPWGNLLPDQTSEKTRNPDYMGSSYVPLDSWAYPALDRLIALGYINTAHVGIRPWTRMECARMLEEAGQKIGDEDELTEASRLYSDLSKEFGEETARLNGAANVGAVVESVYGRATNISGPPLRDGYHFGQTIVNDFGRPFGEGTSSVFGASVRGTLGPLAFYARGEYQAAPSVAPFTSAQLQAMATVDFVPPSSAFSVNTGSIHQFQLLEGAVSLNFRNLQFSFGRQALWLGPDESGSFLYSNNAPPITMFKVDTVNPFQFPLLSKLFGPARAEFFLGRLSGHQWINSPPTLYGPYPSDQPFVHGNKISFKPTDNLEFGAGFTAVFAGAGVPFTFSEFFRTYYAHSPNLAENPGKRFANFDFTYRVPGLRNWLTVYADSLVVDEYSPISSSRASVNPGFYMPQFPKLHKLQLRAEGIHDSLTREFSPGFVYLDARYLSGYTNNGYLLGNWMGRAGWGGQGWATYSFTPRNSLQFSYRAQRVSHEFLQGGSLNDFALRWDQTLAGQFGLSAMVQYENWRFPLLAPTRQSNFTSSVQLTYWPHLGRQRK